MIRANQWLIIETKKKQKSQQYIKKAFSKEKKQIIKQFFFSVTLTARYTYINNIKFYIPG